MIGLMVEITAEKHVSGAPWKYIFGIERDSAPRWPLDPSTGPKSPCFPPFAAYQRAFFRSAARVRCIATPCAVVPLSALILRRAGRLPPWSSSSGVHPAFLPSPVRPASSWSSRARASKSVASSPALPSSAARSPHCVLPAGQSITGKVLQLYPGAA